MALVELKAYGFFVICATKTHTPHLRYPFLSNLICYLLGLIELMSRIG